MNKKYRTFSGLVATVLVCVLVASVFGMNYARGANEKQSQQPKVVEGNRLYVAMQKDMPNYNSFDLGSNTVWKYYVLGWVFDSLSGLDTDGTVYPALAEKWDFYENNLTVIVTLRKNVTFHDDQPLTADDVVFTYKVLRDGTTYSSNLVNAFDGNDNGRVEMAEITAGVTKIDDYHIKFVMAKPYGQFFLSTLGLPIIPKHIWQTHLTGTPPYEEVVDVAWNDLQATIGSGTFKYTDGKQDVFRLITRNEKHWSKLYDFTTPAGAKIFPAGVSEIYYKIYSDIDTAILALEGGEVDYIAWALTPGKIPEVEANPATGVVLMPDNGYFYLAFNQKREPVNRLPFRRAVSYCIDKATIVTRYMGGYGQAGDSCEPPFWEQWYNKSVEQYAFDLTKAAQELDNANFRDTDNDGWRNMPDGRAIPPITILTPPADYDPIRIKAGTMIASNLRSIGIDASAKAVDFDTLVAKMNAFDYTMLIIGWALSADPIGNVFDILGPTAPQNYFAFWSANHPNPYYSNIGGVSTLADAETQAYADLVYELGKKATETFDRAKQIEYTKWAQGVISKALPVNVLYYRINAEGYAKAWSGWTPFMGSIFNGYSLANLRKGIAPPPEVKLYKPILNVPSKIWLETQLNGTVLVVDQQGQPAPGVAVSLSADTTNVAIPESGTTNAQGLFTFPITGKGIGYATITATTGTGATLANDSASLECMPALLPKVLYVKATPDKLYLTAGEQVNVTLNVVDETGAPVSEATVTIDKNLIKYGSLDPPMGVVTTDASGNAVIKYIAPATLDKNKHLDPTLACEVSKANYRYSATTQLNLIVYNSAESEWNYVRITNITHTVCNATNASTNVTVKAGSGESLSIHYSNATMLVNPPSTVVTEASGYANVTLTFNSTMTKTAALRVKFQNLAVPNSLSDVATILYRGTTDLTELYGGIISINVTPINPAFGTLDVTVRLWNLSGQPPADNVSVGLAVSATPDGSLATLAETYLDSAYDWAGLQLSSVYDETSLASSGPFIAELAQSALDNLRQLLLAWYGVELPPTATATEIWTAWDENEYGGAGLPLPHNINITDGTTLKIVGQMASLRDLVSSIYVLTNARMTAFDGSNWFMMGDTMLSTDFVNQRGFDILAPKYTMNNATISAKGIPSDTIVSAVVYDQQNHPVQGAKFTVYEKATRADTGRAGTNIYLSPSPASVTTDANGSGIIKMVRKTPDAKNGMMTSFATNDIYLKATKPGYITVLENTKVVIAPMPLLLELKTSYRAEIGSSVEVKAILKDALGTAVSGANVSLMTSAGALDKNWSLTDENGTATFTLATAGVTPTVVPFTVCSLTGKASPASHVGVSTTFKLELYTLAPVITITNPKNGTIIEVMEGTKNTTVELKGYVIDSDGVAAVEYKLDTENWNAIQITPGLNVSFSVNVVLSIGNHTLSVRAKDVIGRIAETSVSVMVKVILRPTPVIIIRITEPVDGTTIEVEKVPASVKIRGWASNTDGIKSVSISIDGGAWTEITITPGTNVSFEYTATNLNAGRHTVQVKAVNINNITATSNVTFTIKKKAPALPVAGAIAAIAAAYVLVMVWERRRRNRKKQ